MLVIKLEALALAPLWQDQRLTHCRDCAGSTSTGWGLAETDVRPGFALGILRKTAPLPPSLKAFVRIR